MILKGDRVRLSTGDEGEVVEVWGIVREWCKLRVDDQLIYTMVNDVEFVSRPEQKRRGRA